VDPLGASTAGLIPHNTQQLTGHQVKMSMAQSKKKKGKGEEEKPG
jgi:hypothetical protein